MRGRIVAGLVLSSFFFVVGGDAQNTDKDLAVPRAFGTEPVWTLEFIKVRPENFGPAMGYLDDHWMRVRAEAKRQGAVLDYHRIQNAVLVTPGHKMADPSSIVLLTEYKNMDAYMESQKLFDSMHERTRFEMQGLIGRGRSLEDLAETLNTQVFVEEPDASTAFKLLTKQ